jgi:hypothetical protein
MERLRDDPSVRLAATDKRGVAAIDQSLPSQPTCSRLLAHLSSRHNRRALLYALLDMAIAAHRWRRKHRFRYITVDLDSTDFETNGQQKLATYNGYYGHTCYHALVASIAETQDLCGLWARKGSVSSAKGTNAFLTPILDRLEGTIGQVLDVRFDAAFATPAVMDELDARSINFVGRLRSNSKLDELATPYLSRPVGRPPSHRREWYYDLSYRAESWPEARRVVLVVVDEPERRFLGRVQLETYFLVTSHSRERMPAADLVAFYRQRGTFESQIGEFKQALKPRLSSPSGWRENAALLSLYAIAYQWLHIARTISDTVERRPHRSSLQTFRRALLTVAVSITTTGRYLRIWLEANVFDPWSRIATWLNRRAQQVRTPP